MSLRQAQERLEQGSACKFLTVISALDKDDLAVLGEWIEARKASNWISRVLMSEGIACGEKTVKRHLDGLCNCSNNEKWKGAYA
jgi:hypothetical protein